MLNRSLEDEVEAVKAAVTDLTRHGKPDFDTVVRAMLAAVHAHHDGPGVPQPLSVAQLERAAYPRPGEIVYVVKNADDVVPARLVRYMGVDAPLAAYLEHATRPGRRVPGFESFATDGESFPWSLDEVFTSRMHGLLSLAQRAERERHEVAVTERRHQRRRDRFLALANRELVREFSAGDTAPNL